MPSNRLEPGTAILASADADTLTFTFRPGGFFAEFVGINGESRIGDELRGSLSVRERDLLPLQLIIESMAPLLVGPTIEAGNVRLTLTLMREPVAGVVMRSMARAGDFKLLPGDSGEPGEEETVASLDLRQDFGDYGCHARAPDAD